MEIARTDDNDNLFEWLTSVGAGDMDAFSELYDSLAAATYALCALSTTPMQDDAMRRTWLYIWVNAASLQLLNMPTRALVLNIAHEMATRTR